jgi:galactokinase
MERASRSGDSALTTFAPGRVNLIGEHTDYSGGLVMPAAIERGIEVAVRSKAAQVSLTSERFGPAETFAADGAGSPVTGWARYAQAVAAELAALGRPPRGFVGTVASDLPARTGLSSSAALELAVALALCAVAEFELEPLDLALACQRAELRAVGIPCGILDQAASVLGCAGSAILLDCATLEHRLVPFPEDATLVVVSSGVERSLENTAYADRRRELERALRLVGADRSTAVAPAELDRLDPVSQRRLRHVVTENARVRRFAAALEAGDLVTAGRLLGESHASLRDDYEVSIAELDLLVELAHAAGAYGARLLGGGFGGSVLVLAHAVSAEATGAEVLDRYRSASGLDGHAITVRPSAGATVHR